MKRGGPQHPKVRALACALSLPRYAAVGVLECLWHFTAQYAPRGDIGRYDDETIAHALDWDRPAEILLTALCATGLLTAHPRYRLIVHDWHEHADQAVTRLLARRGESFVSHGKRKGKLTSQRLDISSLARGYGSCIVSSGEGEESEKGKGRAPAELVAAFEERFWPAYPARKSRREKKAEAREQWLKIAPDADLEARIVAAAVAYGEETELPVDAVRFLRHRRWEDERLAASGKPRQPPPDPAVTQAEFHRIQARRLAAQGGTL